MNAPVPTSTHSVTQTLAARQPFDWARSLEFMGGFVPCLGEQCIARQTLLKGLRSGGRDVVAEVTAAPGGQVEAGQPLVRIVNLGRLQVRGRVFEQDLGRLREAAGAATVTADAYGDVPFRARLLSTGAVVDPASRTLDAIFSVENPRGLLKAGQTVNLDVALGGAEASIVVPADAVVRDEAGASAVFVHPAPEAFVRRRVTLGPETAAGVVVRSGLAAGERVVVEGAYSIRAR